jgi:hypothetical protein
MLRYCANISFRLSYGIERSAYNRRIRDHKHVCYTSNKIDIYQIFELKIDYHSNSRTPSRDHRKKGYSAALISYLIHCHASVSANPTYIRPDTPIAIHVYKRVGFIEIEHAPMNWATVEK